MSGFTLAGHHWTRAYTAQHLGVPALSLASRDDIVHIGGTWLEEVYPAIQFNSDGLNKSVTEIVARLSNDLDPSLVCDWLQRPNVKLSGATPVEWVDAGRPVTNVLGAVPDQTWLGSVPKAG